MIDTMSMSMSMSKTRIQLSCSGSARPLCRPLWPKSPFLQPRRPTDSEPPRSIEGGSEAGSEAMGCSGPLGWEEAAFRPASRPPLPGPLWERHSLRPRAKRQDSSVRVAEDG
jgi:hypothetical protein